jgi:ribonuclease Z
MMRHLQESFAFDIHVRRDLDEKVSATGIEVIARDIQQGVIYNQNGVKITAFLVDHGAVKPAFGYRVDYNGRAVALSGDTRPSENLVAFSKGVDVLIHEAIDEVSLRKMAPSERLFRAIVEHHTTPEQAADIFHRVGPRLAVFSHAQGGPAVIDRTRRSYPGRVEMGEDLMLIEIGDEVVVRRRGPGPPR